MPTRRWLAPAIGLSAAALAIGTSTAAFAAAPAHAAAHHVHARGDVMHPSRSHGASASHLSPVSAAHHHGKVVLHDTSDNWAGYAATGGNYTSVSSSWVQPSVSCGSEDTYSSFWVGIDGDGTSSVEQTGTEADCSGGQAEYSSWYEMYPANPVNYSDDVEPGDSFTASVTTDGSGNFTLTLTDNTQGWNETTTQSSTTAQDGSAEVIAEAPYSNGVLPLSDFGEVDFTGATANGSPIGDASPTQINLVSDGGTTEATTSSLDSSGEDFSVTWESSGS
ncbi:MAG TPA: G1 family glutamic endopeptidase [Actinospica sp.]|nr:G1 family glutamic endopeptidase [Actinospica sp.]